MCARGDDLRKSAVFLTASTFLFTMLAVVLILWLHGRLGRIPLVIGTSLLNRMGIAVNYMAKEARGVENALKNGLEDERTKTKIRANQLTHRCDALIIINDK